MLLDTEAPRGVGARAVHDGRQTPPPPRWAGTQRVLLAMLALLVFYGALSLLNDPRGTLGTDTGGKLATLRAMDERGALDPDLGYWAARYDPDGHLHPLYYTDHVGHRWVNVTTLPMLYAAYPLYLVGGERAVLALPMLGAVLAALAARALAERMRRGSGWWAFWAVGIASPVALYALDFWEHAPGVAAVLWATVLAVDVAERRAGWRGAAAAGLLLGFAATMRTEALVYAVVMIAVVCARRLRRGEALRRVAAIGAMTTGATGVVLLMNQVLERVTVGAGVRAGRAAGTAGRTAGGLDRRVDEALTSTIGFDRFPGSADWLLGAVVIAALGVAAWAFTRRDPRSRRLGSLAIAVAALGYAIRFSDGLGFVPGLLTASPLAVAGVLLVRRSGTTARTVGLVALVPVPIIWATAFTGGATAQWGGRYVLMSGALLAVVGVTALGSAGRTAAVVFITAGMLVTATGVAWLSARSHTLADAMEHLVDRHDEVLVSGVQHLLREGGAYYEPDHRWLTATTAREIRMAFETAQRSGAREVGLVQLDGDRRPRALGEFIRAGQPEHLEIVPGVPVVVTTYTR
ncbi:MAG: hypothetical protein WEB19_00760 [Acidimicrobiia bacterium]